MFICIGKVKKNYFFHEYILHIMHIKSAPLTVRATIKSNIYNKIILSPIVNFNNVVT